MTLHMISGIKVMTCSQHANTTRLVCPKTHCMYIFNCLINQWHTMFCFSIFRMLTLCFSQVWSMTRLVCKLTQINMLKKNKTNLEKYLSYKFNFLLDSLHANFQWLNNKIPCSFCTFAMKRCNVWLPALGKKCLPIKRKQTRTWNSLLWLPL